MQVKDLMSTHIVSVAPEENVQVAARLLSRNNVGVLPVCAPDGTLEGMLTDRDIVLRCVAAQEDPAKITVRNIMTSRVVAAEPEEDARTATARMAREQIRRLPVCREGRVVGMLSLGDVAVRQELSTEAAELLGDICGSSAKWE